jgi:hypothetical protein
MASGHVTAPTGRTHGCTDQCCKGDESPCQPGAVHTCHLADVVILPNVRFAPKAVVRRLRANISVAARRVRAIPR